MHNLDHRERARLLLMLKYRDRDLTLGELVRTSWTGYVAPLCLFAVVFSALVALTFLGVVYALPVAFLYGGVMTGVVIRDLQNFRRTQQAWPISRAVTDWKQVERLLDEDDGTMVAVRNDEPKQ